MRSGLANHAKQLAASGCAIVPVGGVISIRMCADCRSRSQSRDREHGFLRQISNPIVAFTAIAARRCYSPVRTGLTIAGPSRLSCDAHVWRKTRLGADVARQSAGCHLLRMMLDSARPEAVVCANDVTVARLMQTLMGLGVRAFQMKCALLEWMTLSTPAFSRRH